MPRNIDRSVRRKTRLANKPAFKKAITKRKRDRKKGKTPFVLIASSKKKLAELFYVPRDVASRLADRL